jgi:hypothetical protein
VCRCAPGGFLAVCARRMNGLGVSVEFPAATRQRSPGLGSPLAHHASGSTEGRRSPGSCPRKPGALKRPSWSPAATRSSSGSVERTSGRAQATARTIAFPFPSSFAALSTVQRATLALDLMPGDPLITTDFLAFADNNSQRLVEMYGNQQLYPLPLYGRTTVTFDLTHFPGQFGSGLYYDLSGLLLDGDLNVIYEDATVYTARLQVTGTPALVSASVPTWGASRNCSGRLRGIFRSSDRRAPRRPGKSWSGVKEGYRR